MWAAFAWRGAAAAARRRPTWASAGPGSHRDPRRPAFATASQRAAHARAALVHGFDRSNIWFGSSVFPEEKRKLEGVVAAVTHGLGLNDKFSYNLANVAGVGVATIFRLYCYRRWVFLLADDALHKERLEPETTGL